MTLRLISLVFALVSFLAAALEIRPPRLNMVGVGLMFWVLSEVVK